ncbi:hypothetical protein [Psychrobacter sp. SZ93C1]|nr:hypothetical protein [Psychrobacter sp. SZ93C1]MBH0065409.1 hypothetical protein [Psychrobacter sp. SZ93C1]
MPTDHLPLTERSEEVEFNAKWERCRAMIKDKWLPNEQRENNWLNGKQYHYVKLGNQVIKGPANHLKVGVNAFAVEYKWKHSYIEYDIETREYYLAPPDARSGVYFDMYSVNNLAYQSGIAITSNYDEVCEKSKTEPDEAGAFIWNGILFATLTRIEYKGDNQINWQEEWQRICPIAVEAVTNQLKIIKTQPPTMIEK